MFSNGQLIFAVLFALVFCVVIVLTYRKDKKLHTKNYKGVKWVGIMFITFILILFYIKYFLNN